MFGNKREKHERLDRIIELLTQYESLSAAQIAQKLRVPRSTIMRDLPLLEARGIYLHEDEHGRLSLIRWW